MTARPFMLFAMRSSRGREARAWRIDEKRIAIEATCVRCGQILERQELSTDNTQEEIRAAAESREEAWHHHLREIHGEEP